MVLGLINDIRKNFPPLVQTNINVPKNWWGHGKNWVSASSEVNNRIFYAVEFVYALDQPQPQPQVEISPIEIVEIYDIIEDDRETLDSANSFEHKAMQQSLLKSNIIATEREKNLDYFISKYFKVCDKLNDLQKRNHNRRSPYDVYKIKQLREKRFLFKKRINENKI